MSKKQPFCDKSHIGTLFRPISFRVSEKCDKINLCGCKLSKMAPFCDGKTCIQLQNQDREEIKKISSNLTKLENK